MIKLDDDLPSQTYASNWFFRPILTVPTLWNTGETGEIYVPTRTQ